MPKNIKNLRRMLIAMLTACIVLAAMPIVSFSAGETGSPAVLLVKTEDVAAEDEPAVEEAVPPTPSAIVICGGAVIIGQTAAAPAAFTAEAPVSSGPIITGGAMVLGMPAPAPVAVEPEVEVIADEATATEAAPAKAEVPYSAVAVSVAKSESSSSIILPSAVVILPYAEPVVAEIEEPPMAPIASEPAKDPEAIVIIEEPKKIEAKAATSKPKLSDEIPYSGVQNPEDPGQGIEEQLYALGAGLAIMLAGLFVMKRSR